MSPCALLASSHLRARGMKMWMTSVDDLAAGFCHSGKIYSKTSFFLSSGSWVSAGASPSWTKAQWHPVATVMAVHHSGHISSIFVTVYRKCVSKYLTFWFTGIPIKSCKTRKLENHTHFSPIRFLRIHSFYWSCDPICQCKTVSKQRQVLDVFMTGFPLWESGFVQFRGLGVTFT